MISSMADPAEARATMSTSVMGIGGQHGFSLSAPLQPGSNSVCVYAIGVDPNNAHPARLPDRAGSVPAGGFP